MLPVTQIDARLIVAGDNDRTTFHPADLRKLADNIAAHGLIQPVTVRQMGETDLFQIIAGERRYRATQLLGWEEVPCLVVDLSDEEAAAVMLAENTGRSDLDPIDEGRAYVTRIERFGWTVADCAHNAGVSEVRVQFRLKLLRLPVALQAAVRAGDLSVGYAQILSDANLDPARSMIAFGRLRDNPRPNVGWFRRQVSELLSQQASPQMFESLPILGGALEDAGPLVETFSLPHPATSKPPLLGETPQERIGHQIAFWNDAAEAWQQAGKPFRRQECQAAASALQSALFAF